MVVAVNPMRMLAIFAIVVLFAGAPVASAMCVWGIPLPERIYRPVDATDAFLSYENGVQTLVVKPEFQGDAIDFAIIYPTPSRPDIAEGPEGLFEQLDDATNPPVPQARNIVLRAEIQSFSASTDSVTVIEQKEVGDYTATVLTATRADALIDWLRENGYNFTAQDAEKIDYYVAQPGYHFIALKVNMGEVNLGANGEFIGELEPVQFSFATQRPQLPMRTMKGDVPRMTFDLYTLSSDPLYVPGVDTVWSDVVDASFLGKVPALQDYNPKGKRLLRQEVRFSPKKSDEDLFLIFGGNDFGTATPARPVRVNPQLLDPRTGVIPGTRGWVVRTAEDFSFNRDLGIGSVGADVRRLQMRLNAEGFLLASSGFGSPGEETSYFGERTRQALTRYQNFFRNEIGQTQAANTGALDAATRRHMNGRSSGMWGQGSGVPQEVVTWKRLLSEEVSGMERLLEEITPLLQQLNDMTINVERISEDILAWSEQSGADLDVLPDLFDEIAQGKDHIFEAVEDLSDIYQRYVLE